MDRLGEDPKVEELCKAAKEGDIAAAKSLLDAGVGVNARNRFSGSPLYYACWNGHVDIARLLLEHGAVVNARDTAGFTPLHWACMHDGVEILKLILEYGKDRIDVNCRTSEGVAPFTWRVGMARSIRYGYYSITLPTWA